MKHKPNKQKKKNQPKKQYTPRKKRLRKKQHKKDLQVKVSTINPDLKAPEKLTQKELDSIITQHEKKQSRKNYRGELRNRKLQGLSSLGFDTLSIKAKHLDKIKMKDIESGNVNRETYPFLFGLDKFDFNKVYLLKDNERLYIAFRDFSGEKSLEEILEQFDEMSNEKLLSLLEEIVTMPCTYNRKSGVDSSGAAGEVRTTWGAQNVITDFQYETYNINRRKAKKKKVKKHEGQYKGFQVMKDGRRNSFAEVTPHGLLVIMNAIMWNVTENDRKDFYNNKMYPRIVNHMPDFAAILPKPQ